MHTIAKGICNNITVLFRTNCGIFVNKMSTSKNLAAFDFDNTIVNGNSDIVVLKLLPPHLVPPYKKDGWTAYMQTMFNLLHEQKIYENSIKQMLQRICAIIGMQELIQELHRSHNYDIIIISDSNSYFINNWLKINHLEDAVKAVITNPARFENNLLKVEMCKFQDSCKLCEKNMCKGELLTEFICNQKKQLVYYKKIMYVGDGCNDFCPMLRLSENDLACCRKGFKISELVIAAQNGKEYRGAKHEVRAKILEWENGNDILNSITKNCET